MAHDVFISHAHKDKKIARAICEKLESARLKCWIAERDISPGEDWTDATRNAIGSSRVMVLVLSENANAASHIEREIAHAFYTKRDIVPVRFTQALPRRDFLFYLGNVRCLDAFSAPAEQHLDALTTSITDLVSARSVTDKVIPRPNARITKAPGFSDSWIGALRASHYGTLAILKQVMIAVSVLAVGWLVWFIFWEAKSERSPRENDLRVSRLVTGNPPISKPTYTYTRFGLWVPPNTGSSPSIQEGPKESDSAAGLEHTPPTPGVGQNETAEAESLRDGERTPPGEERPAPVKNPEEGHRGRWRHKIHNGRVRASEERLAEIKKRLKALRHQMVKLSKETGNR
ncbi:MAG: toll/interleukin-1 receptor domain-containing protein [Verrucomicrobia bacterium]|nr:toll/interleukin-1 receptor domain-containing protein [Verrucomicrobiota bacterium]